jgi:hypothetical protein
MYALIFDTGPHGPLRPQAELQAHRALLIGVSYGASGLAQNTTQYSNIRRSNPRSPDTILATWRG